VETGAGFIQQFGGPLEITSITVGQAPESPFTSHCDRQSRLLPTRVCRPLGQAWNLRDLCERPVPRECAAEIGARDLQPISADNEFLPGWTESVEPRVRVGGDRQKHERTRESGRAGRVTEWGNPAGAGWVIEETGDPQGADGEQGGLQGGAAVQREGPRKGETAR